MRSRAQAPTHTTDTQSAENSRHQFFLSGSRLANKSAIRTLSRVPRHTQNSVSMPQGRTSAIDSYRQHCRSDPYWESGNQSEPNPFCLLKAPLSRGKKLEPHNQSSHCALSMRFAIDKLRFLLQTQTDIQWALQSRGIIRYHNMGGKARMWRPQ